MEEAPQEKQPREYGKSRSIRVTVRICQHEYEQLASEAARRGILVSRVARERMFRPESNTGEAT